MYLSSISLKDFRNYKEKSFKFSALTSIIFGPNAAGKTNILEAIFSVSAGKSFRADQDREMILWGRELARINATLQHLDFAQSRQRNTSTLLSPGNATMKGENTNLEVVLTMGMVGGEKVPYKKYAVNGVGKRMTDFIGNLRTVLFWPEDLEMVIGSPSRRRKYLDFVLVQIDREYRRTMVSYEKGLRQRNRLLEAIREGNAKYPQLFFWNELLIKDGEYMTKKREEYIDFINNFSFDVAQDKNFKLSNYQLYYDKSIISEARLEQYKNEEIAAGITLVGPHRDDFQFRIKNSELRIRNEEWRDLSQYGSRGEQRLAILWLKMAELSYMEKISGEKPVLLLDDIFSEFDHEHRKLVFDILGGQQTIMTTADRHFIEKNQLKNIELIELTA